MSLAIGASLTVAAAPASAAGGLSASISNGVLTFADTTSAGHWMIVDFNMSGPHMGTYSVGNFGSDPVTAGPGCSPGEAPNVVYCDYPSAIIIDAGAGNDVVSAGPNATLFIGMVVVGGPGDDRIFGSSMNDWLIGGDGTDTINGNGGHDTIQGGAGNDVLNGGDYNDTIHGDAGDDTIHGNAGDDTIYGNAGNDRLNGDTGADDMYGNAGTDTVTYADRDTNLTITLDDVANDGAQYQDAKSWSGSGTDNVHSDIETVEAGSGNDRIWGRANAATTILGGAGNDWLYGGSGADIFLGQDGNDRLEGRAGNDVLVGGRGDDVSYGQDGDDTIVDGFIYSLEGGNDWIVGHDGKDVMMGFSGDDVVIGTDTVGTPGYGTETIDCGSGNDLGNADPGDVLISCP